MTGRTIAGMDIADVNAATLEEIGPKPDPVRGSPVEYDLPLHSAPGVEVGVWECTSGAFRSSKEGITEVMHFTRGSGTITGDDGVVHEIRPGAVVTLPAGWTGVFDLSEPTRKVYTIVEER